MVPGAPGWGEDDDPVMLHDGERARVMPLVPGDQRQFYRELAAGIRGEAPIPVLPEQALGVMAVNAAAIRSAAEGRTMPIETATCATL